MRDAQHRFGVLRVAGDRPLRILERALAEALLLLVRLGVVHQERVLARDVREGVGVGGAELLGLEVAFERVGVVELRVEGVALLQQLRHVRVRQGAREQQRHRHSPALHRRSLNRRAAERPPRIDTRRRASWMRVRGPVAICRVSCEPRRSRRCTRGSTHTHTRASCSRACACTSSATSTARRDTPGRSR